MSPVLGAGWLWVFAFLMIPPFTWVSEILGKAVQSLGLAFTI